MNLSGYKLPLAHLQITVSTAFFQTYLIYPPSYPFVGCNNSMEKLAYLESIREYLKDLSNPQKQLGIGAIEIINNWFDDLYVPADDPNLYNPGVFEKGLREFESCFSKVELAALKKFHEYFVSIVNDIDVSLPFDVIQKDSKWVNLCNDASVALDKFK